MSALVRHVVVVIFAIRIWSSATASDCLVIPSVSACGVPLDASEAVFEKQFGEPDGRIKMGKDRTGLLDGTNFIVIFWHGRIWEIQNWPGFSPGPTYWFGYVGFGRPDRETRIVFPKWNPWNGGRDRKGVPRDMPAVDGDELSEVRRIQGGSLFVMYDAERVTYLKVNFLGEAVAH